MTMTKAIVVALTCDEPSHAPRMGEEPSTYAGQSAAGARFKAEQAGWFITAERQVCPKCVKRGKR